jgi:hypothetical protein
LSLDLDNEKILERYKKIILGLESLVRIVTTGKSDNKIPITINVHGTFISGDLVSIENFHNNMKIPCSVTSIKRTILKYTSQ